MVGSAKYCWLRGNGSVYCTIMHRPDDVCLGVPVRAISRLRALAEAHAPPPC